MPTQPANRATATIEEVAATFGIARSTAYDLAKRNALPIPVIRLGRRIVVSRVELERALGLEAPRPTDADAAGTEAV